MSAALFTPKIVGQPLDRTDGRAKVTGGARYAAEFPVPNVAHVVLLMSSIASGRIRAIDERAARQAPGVLAIITHQNAPRLHEPPKGGDGHLGEKRLPLQSDEIFYDGQIIGLVVADTLERATEAARLVEVDYEATSSVTEIERARGDAYEPDSFMGTVKLQLQRGDVATALEGNDFVGIHAIYETPMMHHNPMEPHASTAEWRGDKLTIYSATQGVVGYQQATAAVLGIPVQNVRIVSPFLGGGFGCKGFVWAHPFLAAIAAREVGRPAKLVHTRQQMFTANGHRPRTLQELSLAATRDGRLVAVRHLVTTHTSKVDEFIPAIGVTSAMLYASPNAEVRHWLTKLNVGTGTPMRAPGECPGTYALEAAMDELAYALKMDPVQLRLRNFTDSDAQNHKPWSSNFLRDCYARGGTAFGWEKRNPEPRSMRDGRWLIGYGMAAATYPAHRGKASARVRILANGSVLVECATQDIGTGTYTILSQTVADALGVPFERVECRLGDTALPPGPGSGGSRTAASVTPAAFEAATRLRDKLIAFTTREEDSPLHGRDPNDIAAENGRLFSRAEMARGETFVELLRRKNLPSVEAEATAMTVAEAAEKSGGKDAAQMKPSAAVLDPETNDNEEKYAFQSFGAHFIEVAVDPDLGEVRVRRVVSAMDVGRVLNQKTARSQVIGGVVWGIGMALMETTALDHRRGRIVTRNLADYLVPVNADAPDIEVIFIGQPDPHISAMGCRGLGEIGITGITAAIANGVFHATGKRVRDLPITPEKLI